MQYLAPLLLLGILTIFSSLKIPAYSSVSPTPVPTHAITPTITSPTPKHLSAVSSNDPWGIAQQISPHTWTLRINNDPVMGTPAEILSALNDLRRRYGSQPLATDTRLCNYAQNRAAYFLTIQSTDEHKGFLDYLNNQQGFQKLGYGSLGENSSYGYTMSGVHLIEQVYNSDTDHSKNQLDSRWDHGCVGVSGSATDLIFATSPL